MGIRTCSRGNFSLTRSRTIHERTTWFQIEIDDVLKSTVDPVQSEFPPGVYSCPVLNSEESWPDRSNSEGELGQVVLNPARCKYAIFGLWDRDLSRDYVYGALKDRFGFSRHLVSDQSIDPFATQWGFVAGFEFRLLPSGYLDVYVFSAGGDFGNALSNWRRGWKDVKMGEPLVMQCQSPPLSILETTTPNMTVTLHDDDLHKEDTFLMEHPESIALDFGSSFTWPGTSETLLTNEWESQLLPIPNVNGPFGYHYPYFKSQFEAFE